MSTKPIKAAAVKAPAVKKIIPAGRIAIRSEMSAFYGRIATGIRRRSANSWTTS